MNEVNAFLQEYKIIGQVVSALLILVIGRWIAKFFSRLLERVMGRASIEPTITKFIGNFSYIGMFIFVVIIALGKLGIQMNSLIAVVGAAGLAIGLALQGSLSNFAAGIILVLVKPLKKGDLVLANGVEGSVEEIQIFNTVLRGDDNLCHVIPNSKMTSNVVTNYWSNETRRLEFNVNIAYEEDLDRVRAVLEHQVGENPLVLKDPAPYIGVRSLDDSSVNLLVWVWITRSSFRNVRYGLFMEIKSCLNRNGIRIAFPQCDVHLDSSGVDSSGVDSSGVDSSGVDSPAGVVA